MGVDVDRTQDSILVHDHKHPATHRTNRGKVPMIDILAINNSTLIPPDFSVIENSDETRHLKLFSKSISDSRQSYQKDLINFIENDTH